MLHKAILKRRYKRFFAEVLLDNEIVTCHFPNPGTLLGIELENANVWISKSNNPKRKLAYTLEIIETNSTLVGINTMKTNKIVLNSLSKIFPEYQSFTPEVKVAPGVRLDFLLDNKCYLEVKNVTWVENGIAKFPDCPTARGAKHLQHLFQLAQKGFRVINLYVAQRSDCYGFKLADAIDPLYAKLAIQYKNHIEFWAYNCNVGLEEIILQQKLNLC